MFSRLQLGQSIVRGCRLNCLFGGLSMPRARLSTSTGGWAIGLGSNRHGQLGVDKQFEYRPFAERIMMDERHISEDGLRLDEVSVDIAGGWSTNLACLSDGSVYEWGYKGKLKSLMTGEAMRRNHGVVHKIMSFLSLKPATSLPTKVNFFGVTSYAEYCICCEANNSEPVAEDLFHVEDFHAVRVQCGPDVSGVLTKSGLFYTWALHDDLYGKTGHGTHKDQWKNKFATPRRVHVPGRVVDAAYGFNHMALLTENGDIYTCGLNTSGAQSQPMVFTKDKKIASQTVPFPTNIKENIASFYRDVQQTYLHTTDKYKERYSDLNANATLHANVEEMAAMPRAKQEAAFLAEMDASQDNQKLVDGIKVPNTSEISLRSPLPKFKQVACGFNMTAAVDVHGIVWTCGKNSHGELGFVLSDVNKPSHLDRHSGVNTGLHPVDFKLHFVLEPVVVQQEFQVKVKKIAVGHHHVVALAEDNTVYTWGNNEFGQCARLHEQPATVRSVISEKQPWALPPGPVRLSSHVLQGATIVDVTAGIYDTAQTLSDGRCILFGSHIQEAAPRMPFFYEPFQLVKHKTEKINRQLLQVLGPKELAPVHSYTQAQKAQTPEIGEMYQEFYALQKISLSREHIQAIANPRK